MRVVLDTNIAVSWMLSKLGAPVRNVDTWRTQAIVLEVVVSEWLLAEYERVLNEPSVRRRHQRNPEELRALVDEFRQFGVLVEPAELPAVILQDSDDNNVLACAIAGAADYIVSGDPHLPNLREYEGIASSRRLPSRRCSMKVSLEQSLAAPPKGRLHAPSNERAWIRPTVVQRLRTPHYDRLAHTSRPARYAAGGGLAGGGTHQGGRMTTYIFDPAWQRERDRLQALEDLFDDSSVRHLANLGVGPGWRCLEVGCGAGSVALWLAERVGSSGHVLATDLDARFLADAGRDNLDVRTHDILTDTLEEATFDLAHARAVLEHIPERRRALARMVAAVRPGGWVMVEDVDIDPPMIARYVHPPEHAAAFERLVRATQMLTAAVGADMSFGSRLPQALIEAGLEQVGAAAHAPLVQGGAERDWVRLTIEQLGAILVGRGLIGEDELEHVLTLTAQPACWYMPPTMVTAWGRRPAA